MKEKVLHTIEPFFDSKSKILILGSIPSPKSREQGFFYAHPQNRLWKTLSIVLNRECPITIEDKKRLLKDNNIAMWDVLASCNIIGAADSTISNAIPNDFSIIFESAKILQVFTTGKTATQLYKKLTGDHSVYLPSPSAANCSISLEDLVVKYSIIKKWI